MISRIKNIIRKESEILENAKRVRKGFKTLHETNRTPEDAYLAMRKLFVETNGKSNNIISRLLRKKGYDDISVDGVLGLKNMAEVKKVVDGINANGFYVFEKKLSADVVDAITRYAKTTPCKYLKVGTGSIGYSEERILFDENSAVSPRYQFSQQQIIDNKSLQQLIFDQSLLAVAQEYLGTRPILYLLAMWWSVPFHGEGKSEAAQMYHFDLDRIKFFKFFFYLTDVDTHTGPHCYVRASHKKLPASLLKDDRLTDEEVQAAFGRDSMMELCGEKGTIMAVDTRGLHKGKELTRDKRLLFQIEFSNSMFGQYYPPCKKPALDEHLEKSYADHRYTYKEVMI